MEYISYLVSYFLENFTSEDISVVQLIVTLGLASVIAVYLFFVYRLLTRKSIYSLRYNIMISAMVLLITAIIFSVQSSVVLSLGAVGALSIVRFRGALKDPLDIVFLFWSVTVGICVGAHMSEIAIILTGGLTLLIFYLEKISIMGSKLLFVEYEKQINEENLLSFIEQRCKIQKVRRQEENRMILEVKCRDEFSLMSAVNVLEGIQSISLVSHEGEHNY